MLLINSATLLSFFPTIMKTNPPIEVIIVNKLATGNTPYKEEKPTNHQRKQVPKPK